MYDATKAAYCTKSHASFSSVLVLVLVLYVGTLRLEFWGLMRTAAVRSPATEWRYGLYKYNLQCMYNNR